MAFHLYMEPYLSEHNGNDSDLKKDFWTVAVFQAVLKITANNHQTDKTVVRAGFSFFPIYTSNYQYSIFQP